MARKSDAILAGVSLADQRAGTFTGSTMALIEPSQLDYQDRDDLTHPSCPEFVESPTHRNRLSSILKLLDEQAQQIPKPRILDVGCGLGNIAIPIAGLGHSVKAIDVHAPSVEIAKSRNPFPNLEFAVQSIEDVDVSQFDILILSEVLEHVSRYRDMMNHITSGLTQEAGLILTVPNGWSAAELLCRPSYLLKRSPRGIRIVRRIKSILSTRDITTADEGTPHVNFFRIRTLEYLFDDLGLTVRKYHRLFSLWPLWETFFSDRRGPSSWPRRDFERSQRSHPSLCALWAFLLKKSG